MSPAHVPSRQCVPPAARVASGPGGGRAGRAGRPRGAGAGVRAGPRRPPAGARDTPTTPPTGPPPPASRLPLDTSHDRACSTRRRPIFPIRSRRSGSSSSSTISFANSASSFSDAYTAASCAVTRASRRSNDTSGRPMAMYSTTLFMDETSLRGFFGSGDRQTSAVDRYACTVSSGTRPVNSTTPSRPRRLARATDSSKASPAPMNVVCTSSRPISLCRQASARRA